MSEFTREDVIGEGRAFNVVTIGGIPYTLQFVDGLMASEVAALGCVEFERQRISIDPELPPQRMAQTIMHEIVHAILYEAGYDEGGDEETVNRVSIAMWHMVTQTDDSLFEDIRELSKGIRMETE